jgi:hypothetical protein
LPKAYRFEGTEVFIRKEGKAVIIERNRSGVGRGIFSKRYGSATAHFGGPIKAVFRQCRISSYLFSAKRRNSFQAWGIAPGFVDKNPRSAESAIHD